MRQKPSSSLMALTAVIFTAPAWLATASFKSVIPSHPVFRPHEFRCRELANAIELLGRLRIVETPQRQDRLLVGVVAQFPSQPLRLQLHVVSGESEQLAVWWAFPLERPHFGIDQARSR